MSPSQPPRSTSTYACALVKCRCATCQCTSRRINAMNVHRSVGLQWKVGLTQFIATVVALTLTVAGFLLFRYFNFTQSAALTLSLMLGLVAAIVGVGITFILARTIKLRLWEA